MTPTNFFLLCISLVAVSCTRRPQSTLTLSQSRIVEKIKHAKSVEKLLVATDTILLSTPDSVLIDVHPKVRFASNGFVLFNCMAKNVVIVSSRGKFVRSFGHTGAGPGEFRSLVAGAVDLQDNIYTFDPLLARVSVFSWTGRLIHTIHVRNQFYVKDLVVNGDGAIFLHHAPDTSFTGFVSVYDSTGFKMCLVPHSPGYEEYYFRGVLEGGIQSDRSGVVFEGNTFTYSIAKIDPHFGVSMFGKEPDGYVPLPRITFLKTLQQLEEALSRSTIIRGIYVIHHGNLILQETVTFSSMGGEPKRFVHVYDSSGVFLGRLTFGLGNFDASNGNLLLQVYEPLPSPGMKEMEIKLPQLITYRLRDDG